MSDLSAIEWTDATWNPVTGCTKVSPGCDHCYAETFAERWRGTPGHHFENGFDITLRPERLDQPLRWRKPRRVFVNSMSDLFHDEVPEVFIWQVFDVMEQAKQHTFQVLTKRHARMSAIVRRRMEAKREYAATFDHCPTQTMRNSPAARYARERAATPPANIWLGVSVEDHKRAELRIPALLATPAAVRFISAEPLLGPVDLRNLRARNGALIDCLSGDVKSSDGREIYAACPAAVNWVIAGGESGPGARPMHPEWVREIRDQCDRSATAFFFKQWGAWQPVEDWIDPGTPPVIVGEAITLDGDPADWDDPHAAHLVRVGKKAAGRVLDGRTWDGYPDTATGTAA